MEELIERIFEASIELLNYFLTRDYSFLEKEFFGVSGVDVLAFIALFIVIKVTLQVLRVRVNRFLGIRRR